MENTSPQLVNLRELARQLRRFGLSAKWLHSEAQVGRLPCMLVGRRLLFNVAAVEEALLRRAAKEVVNGKA